MFYPCNPVKLIFIYLLIAWFCQNVIEGQFVIFVIQDQQEPKEDAYFTVVKKMHVKVSMYYKHEINKTRQIVTWVVIYRIIINVWKISFDTQPALVLCLFLLGIMRHWSYQMVFDAFNEHHVSHQTVDINRKFNDDKL